MKDVITVTVPIPMPRTEQVSFMADDWLEFDSGESNQYRRQITGITDSKVFYIIPYLAEQVPNGGHPQKVHRAMPRAEFIGKAQRGQIRNVTGLPHTPHR